MSKKHYSAKEVPQCLDEDSDSHFSDDDSDSDSDSDENDSEIDVISFHPMDNPSNVIQQVSTPSALLPCDGIQ